MLQSPEHMAQTPESPTNDSAYSPDLYCPNCALEVDDPLTAARLGPLIELLAQSLVRGNGLLVDHEVLGNSSIGFQKKQPDATRGL